LGDFALCRTEEYQKYIDALNGKMILIMGNHDRRRTVTFWKKRGIEAHKNPIIFLPDQYENELPWLLSHEPVMFPDLPNVHGHTHGNIHRGEVSEHGIHVCVSVEVTGYKPVSVDWVKQEIKRKEELNGR
jgi:calcineurin-like phosphoesterase family protein